MHPLSLTQTSVFCILFQAINVFQFFTFGTTIFASFWTLLFFFMANSTHHNTIKFWKEGPPCLRKPLLNKSPNSLHKNYHSVQPPKLVVKIPQLNHLSKYTVCPRGLIIGNCPQIQNKQSKNVTVIHNFFYLCSNFQLTQSIL